jgi:SAM-dependent methyltransferase
MSDPGGGEADAAFSPGDGGSAADPAREEWLQLIQSKLSDGARVLELGCGAGREARRLAERFHVTGVDLVARAAGIEVIEADFLELELPDASFDAASPTTCHASSSRRTSSRATNLRRTRDSCARPVSRSSTTT